MDAESLDAAMRIAKAVRSAVIARHGCTEGQCKAAAVALALALTPLHEPVAICHGEVSVPGGGRHGHVWCRIGTTIIDATGDQFGREAPMVVAEVDAPAYLEHGFVLFNPAEAASLLVAARATEAGP